MFKLQKNMDDFLDRKLGSIEPRRRLNIVAIGRTGDGKSSTLNSLLSHAEQHLTIPLFDVSNGIHTVTKAFDDRSVDILGLECRLSFLKCFVYKIEVYKVSFILS